MVTCPSCGSSVFLDDGTATTGGSSGEMHEAPLPANVGDRLEINGAEFDLVGHARFSYGPGWWDEFWALDAHGDGLWISFDEGDVALQWPIAPDHFLATRRVLPPVGDFIQEWRVNEVEEATCLAVRGSFPERLRVGDTYRFANLEDGHGSIASAEMDENGGLDWTVGTWVDRWQVRRV